MLARPLRRAGFPLLLTALVTAIACYLAYRDVQISARLMLWLQAASVALISFIAIGVIVKHGWRPDMGQLTLQGVTPVKASPGAGARDLQLRWI